MVTGPQESGQNIPGLKISFNFRDRQIPLINAEVRKLRIKYRVKNITALKPKPQKEDLK
jgi:hypothetical protein